MQELNTQFLLPKYAIAKKNSAKMIYIGYEVQKSVLKFVGKQGKISRIDNPKLCYCSNCHKKVQAIDNVIQKSREKYNSYSNEYKDNFKSFNEIGSLSCPECGYSISLCDMRKLNIKYVQSRNVYLDDNKLKIKIRSVIYKNYNNAIIIQKFLNVVVLNLDTGRAYKLPTYKNDKKYKHSGKIREITYNTNISACEMFQEAEEFSEKCSSISQVYREAFNLIREYKMKKLNCYIPTIEEQALSAVNNNFNRIHIYHRDYSPYEYENLFNNEIISIHEYKRKTMEEQSDYISKHHPIKFRLQLLCNFNRLPAVNVYTSMKMFSEHNYVHENFRRKLKIFRRELKEYEINPFKSCVESQGVTFTKGLKKYYAEGLSYFYAYCRLIKLGLKQTNVIKLLESIRLREHKFDIFNSATLLMTISVYYKDIMKFNNYNENALINKLCVALNDCTRHSSHRSVDHIIDIFKMSNQIKKKSKTYSLDLKNNLNNIHDTLSSDYKKLKIDNKIFEYKEKNEKVNLSIEDLTFSLAKDSYELIEVGTFMRICVGSYGESAYNKECYIVIARDSKGDPVICIELDRTFSNIRQTKLLHNSHPELGTDIYDSLIKWIVKTDLDVATYDLNKAEVDKYIKENINKEKLVV